MAWLMSNSWYVEFYDNVKRSDGSEFFTVGCGMDSIMKLDGRLHLYNMIRKTMEASQRFPYDRWAGFRIVKGYGGNMKVLFGPVKFGRSEDGRKTLQD